MTPNIFIRCAIGAAALFTCSAPAPARVLHAPGHGVVRALVMGVDKYPNLGAASALHGAVADAKDLSAALTAVGVKVKTLTDDAVIRQPVLNEIKRLYNESKAGDLVIISYSGHGMKVRGYKSWDGDNRSAYHSQIALANFSPKGGYEFIVDGELRAWYSRFDAKNVDVLVVMDTCYGGHMRQVMPFSGGMTTRSVSVDMDNKVHDSFVPMEMTGKELALRDSNELRHVTFFAGATEESTVPEMTGIDRSDRTVARGALSYFMARAVNGEALQGGKGAVTRSLLFKYVRPNVRAVTEDRQFIDFGPSTEDDAALQQVVFTLDDDDDTPPQTTDQQQQQQQQQTQIQTPVTPIPPGIEVVRVAIENGDKALFSTIEKGRAPFEPSEPSQADVVWDAGHRTAQSRGDLIKDGADGSVLGQVIDRTWAVREIQKLATPRIIDVQMGENGRAYSVGDQPTLAADGVRNSYLTVVNVASDGQLQLLFPFYASHDPHMSADRWTYSPKVAEPLGTDYTVVIATGKPAAAELVKWLRMHNNRHDAFDLPAMLAKTIAADGNTRIGTAGLFTH
jgi:hypothetical protein